MQPVAVTVDVVHDPQIVQIVRPLEGRGERDWSVGGAGQGHAGCPVGQLLLETEIAGPTDE